MDKDVEGILYSPMKDLLSGVMTDQSEDDITLLMDGFNMERPYDGRSVVEYLDIFYDYFDEFVPMEAIGKFSKGIVDLIKEYK